MLPTAMSQPFRLDGRTALVTGGASGIGEATCRAFAAAGAGVYLDLMDSGRAEALAVPVPGSGAGVCDISDEAAVNGLFAGDVPKLYIWTWTTRMSPSGG